MEMLRLNIICSQTLDAQEESFNKILGMIHCLLITFVQGPRLLVKMSALEAHDGTAQITLFQQLHICCLHTELIDHQFQERCIRLLCGGRQGFWTHCVVALLKQTQT